MFIGNPHECTVPSTRTGYNPTLKGRDLMSTLFIKPAFLANESDILVEKEPKKNKNNKFFL